jgi:hypothetical protein
VRAPLQAVRGGALYLRDVVAGVSSTAFRSNTATSSAGEGGAAYVALSPPFTYTAAALSLDNTDFHSNTVSGWVGGWVCTAVSVSPAPPYTQLPGWGTLCASETPRPAGRADAPPCSCVGRPRPQAGQTGGALFVRKDAPGASGVACSERCVFSDNTGVFNAGDTIMATRVGAGITIDLAAATFRGEARGAAPRRAGRGPLPGEPRRAPLRPRL